MKTDRELLEQALKLVAKYHARKTVLVDWEKSVIEAISARLAEDDDEPVLWVDTDDNGDLYWDEDRMVSDTPVYFDNPIPLYRRPLPMARLTDEEISQAGEDSRSVEGNHILPFAFARAIEQKIWEKTREL
jgi:hypothetical protein